MAAFLPFPPWPLVLSEEWAQLERPFSPSERKENENSMSKNASKIHAFHNYVHFIVFIHALFVI